MPYAFPSSRLHSIFCLFFREWSCIREASLRMRISTMSRVCHCERSEAIVARTQSLLRCAPLLLRNKIFDPYRSLMAACYSGRATRGPE